MEAGTVSINNRPQTLSVQWMNIENIYEILHKNGVYTVGETYNGDVPEFRITAHSDSFAKNYLLHIFIQNVSEGSFCVKVTTKSSTKSEITGSDSTLSTEQRIYNNIPENSYNFVKTFLFTVYDVMQLENTAYLTIPIQFQSHVLETKKRNSNIMQNVKLQHTLSSIMDDPVYSDFTVKSSDGKQFKVHRAVLAANSKVFQAMLKEYSAESQQGNVKLIWDSENVTAMLHFMYTGSVEPVHLKYAANILELANYYDIAGLSKLAQRALCESLNNENAVEMIILGDTHNADMVKSAAMKYVIENSDINCDAFKYVNDPVLIKTMFDSIRKYSKVTETESKIESFEVRQCYRI